MTITLTGSNSFVLSERLHRLTEEFVATYGDMAMERIEGGEASIQDIMESIQSIPFLSPKKMVVVNTLSANKEAAGKIEQIIYSAGNSVELIIYEPKIDRRTVYFKLLKVKTKLEEYKELDKPQLIAWVLEYTAKLGGKIGRSEASLLVERLGTDQFLVASEIKKLITFNNEITRGSIEALTEPTPQSRIFDLLDAAFSGDKRRALELYEQQRVQKVEPQAILAMLTWQLYLLAAAKYGSGREANDIAADLNVQPYPVVKSARLAKSISEDKLRQLVNDAYHIDKKGKTTSIDLDEALKTYIVTI